MIRSPDFEGITNIYRQIVAADDNWRYVRPVDAHIELTDIFVMLQGIGEKPSPRQPRPDIVDTPERFERAALLPVNRPLGEMFPGNQVQNNQTGIVSTSEHLHQALMVSSNRQTDETLNRNQLVDQSLSILSPLPQVLEKSRNLVFLGEPGAGKSTTLQYIGLSCAQPEGARKLNLPDGLIPIRIELLGWADRLASSNTLLDDCLAEEVYKYLNLYLQSKDQAISIVKGWISSGSLIVLLDGLDEVPDQLRETVRSKIQTFSNLIKDTDNYIIVTSRRAGYTSVGSQFVEYTLLSLEREDDAEQYLHGWLAALRPEWKANIEICASDLLAEIFKQPGLRRVAGNPLLLRLAAQVYADERTIARNRADLYAKYIFTLWQTAERRGAKKELHKPSETRLGEIAWQLQIGNVVKLAELPHREAVLFREKLGILASQDGKTLVFAHTSLREFYVANHLKRAWMDSRRACWSFLKPRLHLTEWREPLLLLSGLLEPVSADDLARKVLNARSDYDQLLLRDISLTAAMLTERGIATDNPVFKIFLDRVNGLLSTRRERMIQKIPVVGMFAGCAGSAAVLMLGFSWWLAILIAAIWSVIWFLSIKGWWRTGTHILMLFQEKIFGRQKATAVYKCIEALGSIGPPAIPRLIEAIYDPNRMIREKAADALGKIGAVGALPYLIHALNDADDGVRKSAARGLGFLGDRKATPYLINALNRGSWNVCRAAAESLGRLRSVEAVPDLIFNLNFPELGTRSKVANALVEIGEPAAPHLLQALSQYDWDIQVRDEVAQILGRIGTPGLPYLINGIKDQDYKTRSGAINALINIGVPAIPELLEVLKEPDWQLCWAAADALGGMGSVGVTHLIRALSDQNEYSRAAAARALGSYRLTEAESHLRQALSDKEWIVRCSTVYALGLISGMDAMPYLIIALEDKSEHVREEATSALGNIGVPEVMPYLVHALKDRYWEVKWVAREKLIQIGEPAVPYLIDVLGDEDARVRRVVAAVLGEIGADQAELHLKQALSDEDGEVRQAASEALRQISQPSIGYLIRRTKDKDKSIRLEAIKKLGKTRAEEAVPHLLRALRDEDWMVKLRATNAVSQIGTPAIPYLVQALKEDDIWHEAVDALRIIGEPATLHLIQVLKDPNASIRSRAISALREIDSTEAIPHIIVALKDKNWEVRKKAAEVLGHFKSVEAIPRIIEALKDKDSDVRNEAAEVLGHFKSVEAVPHLIQAFSDQDWHVRWSARRSVELIGEPAVPHLIRGIKNEDKTIRTAIVEALRFIGAPESEEYLIQALTDKEGSVRWPVAEALGKMGSKKAIPSMIHALRDHKWDLRRAANRDLEKIIPLLVTPTEMVKKAEQIQALRRLQNSIFQGIWFENDAERYLYLANERLTSLNVLLDAHNDPFEPPPQPGWKTKLTIIGLLILLGIIAVVALLVDVFYDAIKDLLKQEWITYLNIWLDAYPALRLVILIILLSFAGLLVFIFSWLIKKLKEATKTKSKPSWEGNPDLKEK